MPRAVSMQARMAVMSEISDVVKIFLVTIWHRTLKDPIRVSSDPTVRLDEFSDQVNVIYGTRSQGQTYIYAGFDCMLLSDENGAAPQVQLSLPNASRDIIEAIERMGSGPIQVDIKLVLAPTPDIVEVDIQGLELTEITYDETTITGNLSKDLLFTEPFPFRSFTPQEYPFMFMQ